MPIHPDAYLGLKRIAEQNDLAQQMQQKSMYDAAVRRQQQQMAMQLADQQSRNRQLESSADMDRRGKLDTESANRRYAATLFQQRMNDAQDSGNWESYKQNYNALQKMIPDQVPAITPESEQSLRQSFEQAVKAKASEKMFSSMPQDFARFEVENPTWKGKVGSQEYADAYKKWEPEFTQRRYGQQQLQGTNPNNPMENIVFGTRSGQTSVVPGMGPAAPKSLNAPSSEETQKLAGYQSARETVGDLLLEMETNPNLISQVGPFSGRWAELASKFTTNEDFIKNRSKLGTIMADYLRTTSGLTVTDAERKYIEENIIGKMTNDPGNLKARLEEFSRYLDRQERIFRGSLKEGYRAVKEGSTEKDQDAVAYAKKYGISYESALAKKRKYEEENK